MSIGRILRDIKREKILNNYSEKDRLINSKLYNELKKRSKCDRCKKQFTHGMKPELHHKIPRSKGGANTRENLLAVCTKCHKILDAEEQWKSERDEYFCETCQDAIYCTKQEWRDHLENHGGKE